MNVVSSCSETPLRPTEAMLRFAQFRMRNNSKRRSEAKLTDGDEDRIERLLRHPKSIQDVIGAESDDGNSTSDGEEVGADKENDTPAPRRDRPALSKGRRALLRVSQRALEKRRQRIKQQGFQYPCCSPVSQEEEEETVVIFHQRSSEESTYASLNLSGTGSTRLKNKVNSRRISVGSIRKKKRQRITSIRKSDPERSRRFNAAFQAALTSSLSERKGEVASVQRAIVQKRWTRPSLGATDAPNFIEWIDNNNTRKRAVHNPTSPSKAPLDRGASWLVHLPRKPTEMSPKRTPPRHTTADVVARSGRSYQSLTPEMSRQVVASGTRSIFSCENETIPANTTARDNNEHSMESGVASLVDQSEQHLMATNAVAAKSPDRLSHGWTRTYVGTGIPPTVTYDSDEDSMCSSEDNDPFSSVLLDSSYVHPNRPTDESLSSQGLLLRHQTGSPLDISSSSTDVVIGDASGVVDCKMNNITALGGVRLSAAFRVSLEGESRGPTMLGAMGGQKEQITLASCGSERSVDVDGVSVDGESNIRVTTTEPFCIANDREDVMPLMDPNNHVSGDVKPTTTIQDQNSDVYASIAKIVEETLSLVDSGMSTYDMAPAGTMSDDDDGLSVVVETTNDGAAVASPREDRVSQIKEQTGLNSSFASWSSWSGQQALGGDSIRTSGIESLSLIANELSVQTPGTSDTNHIYQVRTARSPESICSAACDESVCSVAGQDTASNDQEETDSSFSDNDFLSFQNLSGLIVDDVLQSLAAWSVDDSTLEGNFGNLRPFGSNSARSTSHKADLLIRSPKLSVHGDVGDRELVKESDSIAPEETIDSEVTPQDPVAPPPRTMYFADWSISKASTISFFKKLGVGSGYTSSGPSKERQATRRPAPKQRNRSSRSYVSANNTAGCGLSTERAGRGGEAVDFDVRWEKRLMM